jgi:hypothetical protein
MVHWQRRRNANEFCGAYGQEFTFSEMRWLAHWLLLRGCNLLIPHAFYYSVRGPRLHERPPDVGPNSAWWDDGFARFATVCAQLAWLNTDSEHICSVAILGQQHRLPWRAARVCYEHQIDFNYLDPEDLLERATLGASGVTIGSQTYQILIVDSDLSANIGPWLENAGDRIRLIHWSDDSAACLAQLRIGTAPKLKITPAFHGLRRRVRRLPPQLHRRRTGRQPTELWRHTIRRQRDQRLCLPIHGKKPERGRVHARPHG